MKKIFLASIVSLVLIAQPAQAVSLADLQGQINSLMQLVQDLIARVQNLNQTPPTGPIVVDPLPPSEQPTYNNDAYLQASNSSLYVGDTVFFTTSHGDGNAYPPSHSDGQDTRIDFGDDTAHEWVHCATGNKNLFSTGKCTEPATIKHVYKKPGTFTAQLVKEGGYCRAPGCPVTTLASIQVQVKEADAVCTKEYAPVCAQPQGCSPCPDGAYCTMLCNQPEPRTYSNKCEMNGASARFLYTGECKTIAPSNTPPVIESFSGPTVLEVREAGLWKIEANDKENNSLTYRVDWGDRPQILYAENAPAKVLQDNYYTQSTTFEHSYDRAGKFTVRMTVQDEHGLQVNTSTTVVVKQGGGQSKISETCQSWYDGCNTCSRSYIGGPAICTLRACYQQEPAYCKVYFDTTSIPLPEPLDYNSNTITEVIQNLETGDQSFNQILNSASDILNQLFRQ